MGWKGWPVKVRSLALLFLVGLYALVQGVWIAGGIPLAGGVTLHSKKRWPPQRIVSVNLGSDEILLSLVPERVVAVSYLAVDPGISNVVDAARKVPHKLKTDAEKILAFNPDLVVLGGHTSADVVDQLKKAGLSVVRLQRYGSIQEIEETILELGEAVGEAERAQRLVAQMQARIKAIAERTAKTQRARLISYNPSGFTAGRETIFDDLVRYAGGLNLSREASIKGFKKLSLERLLVMDPEVIITSAWTPRSPRFFQEFSSHPALKEVSAFKSERVFQLPGRYMVTTSHYIADGVEALARLLHPDLFGDMP